jgi:hypothetical protein
MKRLVAIAVAALAVAPAVRAQEPVGSSGPVVGSRPGWTLTPSMGFGEAYDDNISLFGIRTAEQANNDVVQSWFPGVDLNYEGRHTSVTGGYQGSFVAYHTFSTLNRWGQHGHVDIKRQENARLKWTASGNLLSVPTTDMVDVGGLPFRRTGVTTSDGRGGMTYVLNGRDAFSFSAGYQTVDFDQPVSNDGIVHGGHAVEGVAGWRHKISSRLALGADYGIRRALVIGAGDAFDMHSAQGAVDYDLSESWVVNASGGIAYLAPNGTDEARTGPAWRAALERRRAGRSFHVAMLQAYIPSFGFGGTVRNQELNVGLHMPLFHSRRWYTEQTVIFRDDRPLTLQYQQLPLRSLRMLSLIGWAPQYWFRIEGFYARTQQTNFGNIDRGQFYRNRIGFQIVTSKPVRMQ